MKGDDEFWKALADPTRRQILDRLRQGPQTTGDLAEAFPTSRYAVMKHLSRLVDVGLVLVRRQGRTRWNHLNPVPIRTVAERWLHPYANQGAAMLTHLARWVERDESEAAMSATFGVVDLEMEISLNAPRERVWTALVQEASYWWPADFYTHPKPEGFVLEAKVGGRMMECGPDGEGLLWATVIGVRQGEVLETRGDLTRAFGGPGLSHVRFDLADDGDGCRLKLSQTLFGAVDDSNRSSLDSGWKLLFGQCFKGYVDDEVSPTRPESVLAALGSSEGRS